MAPLLALLAVGPLLASPSAPLGPAPEPQSSTPNVLIVIADDLGYGDLGCFGAPLIATPNIDALAAQGAKLTSFYVQASCTPTRAALLTGRYAQRVGLGGPLGAWSPVGMHPDEVTLAEILAGVGYRTGLFGKWHLGDSPDQLPQVQGFDTFVGVPWGPTGIPIQFLDSRSGAVDYDPDQSFDTTRYTNATIDFMRDSVAAAEPFFAVVAHTAPHIPASVSDAFHGVSADGRDYGDAVEELDWCVARLSDELDALGVAQDTLIVFFSDNGASTVGDPYQNGSNGPLRGGKGQTWEGGVRVPCVLRWPAVISPGLESDDLICAVDFVPTLLEITQSSVAPNRALDGVDLMPLFTGGVMDAQRPVFYAAGNTVDGVRRGRWKLRRGELYDLETDPGETNDLALIEPAELAELEQLKAGFEASLAADSRPAAPTLRLQELWRADSSLPASGVLVSGETWGDVIGSNEFTLVDLDPLVDLEVVSSMGLGTSSLPLRAVRLAEPASQVRLVRASPFYAGRPPGAPFSVQFWYRFAASEPLEDLVLLDVGDGDAGLSITIGDAGELGDDLAAGRRDDVLLRVGGDYSPGIADLSADLPDDADQRFVHLVVSYGVDGELVLYIDGFEAARVHAPGLAWDGDSFWALLGRDEDLGGDAGSGRRPFPAVAGQGEIALFGTWDRGLLKREVEVAYCRHIDLVYCHGRPNSSGGPAELRFGGSFFPPERRLEVEVNGLPSETLGFLIASRTQARGTIGDGFVCLDNPISRLAGQVPMSDPMGALTFTLDIDFVPPGFELLPGQTWNFQFWYRDGAASNFSNGVQILFCP